MNGKDVEKIMMENYDKLNNLKVPFKRTRFPLKNGVQQKVTLVSNVTGRFKNIAFIKDIENTINGAIADDLLNHYPQYFSVLKVNGKLVEKGKENALKDSIKEALLDELKESYDITPRDKKPTKRDRPEEKELLKDKSGKSKYKKVK